MARPNSKKLVSRFLNKVKKSSNGCWNWVGTTRGNGYGGFKIDGIMCLAHRISYTLFTSNIPQGKDILHICDNTKCVNPDHLILGTHKDNMKDMAIKNRCCHGEDSHLSKLSHAQILEIRSKIKSGAVMKYLATEYGVSFKTIRDIKHRRTWARA